jgi:hypothetical protein
VSNPGTGWVKWSEYQALTSGVGAGGAGCGRLCVSKNNSKARISSRPETCVKGIGRRPVWLTTSRRPTAKPRLASNLELV